MARLQEHAKQTVIAQEEEAAWKTQQLSESLAADDTHQTDDSDDVTFGIKGEKVTFFKIHVAISFFLSDSFLLCVGNKYRV